MDSGVRKDMKLSKVEKIRRTLNTILRPNDVVLSLDDVARAINDIVLVKNDVALDNSKKYMSEQAIIVPSQDHKLIKRTYPNWIEIRSIDHNRSSVTLCVQMFADHEVFKK